MLISAFDWDTENILYQSVDSKTSRHIFMKYVEALRRVIKAPVVDPQELLTGDALFILSEARSLSYGAAFTFDSKCPSCTAVEKVNLNIPDDMSCNMYPSDFDGILEYTTAKGDVVGIKFITLGEEIRCDDSARLKVTQGVVDKDMMDSESAKLSLASHIKTVNGEEVKRIADVVDWFEKDGDSRSEISSFIKKVTPGLTYEIPMICGKCNVEYSDFIPLVISFFRSKSRINVQKLPRGIRLGVIGKDAGRMEIDRPPTGDNGKSEPGNPGGDEESQGQ